MPFTQKRTSRSFGARPSNAGGRSFGGGRRGGSGGGRGGRKGPAKSSSIRQNSSIKQ